MDRGGPTGPTGADGPDRAAWLDALPRLLRDLLAEWGLTSDGEPVPGRRALVLPVRDADNRAAVLKVHPREAGSEHEHLALQHWHGDGAALLLRADPRRGALLLERLHPVDLTDHWDLEACEVVAGLYARLHVPAPPQLRLLTTHVERWTEALADLPRDAPVPHRMVEQAVALGRGFVADPASTGTLVHTDLHYGTVLAADREPWLAVGPEPLSGDPHYEVAPLLHHRWDELDGDVRGGVRRRFHAAVDAAGLDEDRARDWVVVRMLGDVVRALAAHRPDGDRITRCVSIAKAVQD
ncbi:aminoglycoside phosphotransferase family protein [Nocardioides dongxiaopingii]|uniref:aminoglycoside phosphotransferase family protein n=1 Tax=Nocardioides dongxiaopingii TaxID=2576036 RepID=UPI0010C770ED|nr:aminoglycoside phosphotransferase family protein [Nocardioides dongxiaopingii]